MQKSIQISIPEPCSVPWDSMTKIDDQKRHCSSCEKIIYDFTKMSDAELVKFLSANTKACGQFTEYQLNRNLLPAEPVRTRKWPMALLISSVLFAIKSPARNPEKIKSVQTELEKITPAETDEAAIENPRIIEGIVIDSLSNDSLIYAIIWIDLNGMQYSSQTDTNGKFRIVLPASLSNDSAVLHARYVGYAELNLPLESIGENPVLKMRPVVQNSEIVISSGRSDVMVGQIIRYTGIPAIQDPVPQKRRYSRFHGFFYRLFHPRRVKS